jgi:multidrug efflux pump subunit AcrB
MMTLGGIAAAVGLVLDDAIVVIEHLTHRAADPDHAGRARAMAELLPTLAGSSLCTLAIFLPFLFLGGVTGAFFRVLALAMSLMLGASFLMCITVIPLLSRAKTHAPETRPAGGRALDRASAFATRHGWIGVGVAVALIALAIPLQRSLGSGFLPEMDEGSLILDYVSPPGTSLSETDRVLQEVEKLIAATPDVVAWSRRTGDQLGFFITEPNVGDYVLRLKSGRRRGAEAIADDLRARIESSQPGLQIEFGQLVEDVIGDLTTNPQPIEIRVYCEDRDLAERKALEVADLVGRVRGVVDIKSGIVVSGPNVAIVPSPAARRLGVTTEDLAERVTPAVAGVPAGEIVRGARSWNVRVVVPPATGLDAAAALGALTIPLPGGGSMPLGDAARLRTDPGETEIARDNLRTMVAVTARLSGRDLGSAVAEIQRRLPHEVVLPSQVSVRFGGLWAEQQSSFRGLLGVLVGATVLVVLVLLASFRSWRQVLALLVVVLGSLAGVFAALHLTGTTFNISSFVGAIMVVGIVAENGYFLLAAEKTLRREGIDAPAAALAAARRRTRPVLMTTLAGVAALAPLAFGLGGGSELLRPLAIAVIGGFTLSAVLLLVVLPSLLARFGGGGE